MKLTRTTCSIEQCCDARVAQAAPATAALEQVAAVLVAHGEREETPLQWVLWVESIKTKPPNRYESVDALLAAKQDAAVDAPCPSRVVVDDGLSLALTLAEDFKMFNAGDDGQDHVSGRLRASPDIGCSCRDQHLSSRRPDHSVRVSYRRAVHRLPSKGAKKSAWSAGTRSPVTGQALAVQGALAYHIKA